ncbi:MAG: RdgB/HAM1 family non-canonical purine NTP pyrophosphatase [Candidatus Lokiarchaeota archaeon]|jgi:XTP/dITP diphosphohydrolase|nr:RdgB/HAM1 family non-canonical purine NTP pyrophosphatase [Candidatus Lokiarchaeota archaeon]
MEKEKETIYFITGNNSKFNEIQKLFQKEDLSYELKRNTIKTTEIQASSIKEVAIFKLNSVRGKVNFSFFIEDAGFFVDKPLNGFPGVYSKYVLNTIGNKGILNLIKDYSDTKAHFEAVIALFFQPFNETLIFEGVVEGKVAKNIRGRGGFGFDPIFIPKEFPNRTFAELTTTEKNLVSHRGKAWNKMFEFLKKNQS